MLGPSVRKHELEGRQKGLLQERKGWVPSEEVSSASSLSEAGARALSLSCWRTGWGELLACLQGGIWPRGDRNTWHILSVPTTINNPPFM